MTFSPTGRRLAGSKILLYGAGSGCASYFSIVQPLLRASVVGIVDEYVQGSVLGIKITHPDDLMLIPSDTTVIVTIGDWRTFKVCEASLKRRFNVSVIWMLDLYEFHCHFPSKMNIDALLPDEHEFEATLSRLEDDQSKRVFEEAIESHAARRFVRRPCDELSTQYLVPELALPSEIGHVVHCGAHSGGTLEAFGTYFRRIEHLSCFEPTLSFQEQLSRRAEDLLICPEVTIHSVAVGEETGDIFLEDFGGSSTNNRIRLSEVNGSNSAHREIATTTVVALDELFMDVPVDFISMDIEGSEISGLKGARCIISDQRPRLAISAYHSPEDIWKIPLLIDQFAPGAYRMYLRRHTPFNAETVLYCTPY